MKIFTSSTRFTKTASRLALACLLAAQSAMFAQEARPPQPPPQDDPADDVLRVSTSLVQTDVSVVDQKGRFAENLQREQFELKVDGRAQPILFFERATAGSAGEAARIAAARGETLGGRTTTAAPLERGRAVVFFVDDLHLSPEGISRARELLHNFVEREMMPGMHALVASASGQIGFLQQFTNDRAVLRAAVERIKYVSQASLDSERPSMSGYQAEMIDRGDRDLLGYLVSQTMEENGQNYADPGARMSAETIVRNRARRIRRQAAQLSGATVASLESVVRAPAPSGGRQTLFFISEGFTLDAQEADINRKIQRVTDAAARTGTVIYTLYARGLAVGMLDASSGARADLADLSSGTAFRGYSPTAELSATQDVLRGLAADTGGRALINTNALDAAIARTLGETANYYLLAWRPEGVEVRDGTPRWRKIEITVKGRPDLSVRVRRSFLGASPAGGGAREAAAASTPAATASTASASTNAALNRTLNSLNARRDLPVDAYAVFTNDAEAGSVINASVQFANDRLKFTPAAAGQPRAQVEVACVVLDDRGKVVYSNGRTLTLDGNAAAATGAGAARGKIVTNFSIPRLAPGLYQLRAAARDAGSGLVGSAFEWVEVPHLKANRLALSGLLVTERRRAGAQPSGATGAGTTGAPDILRVERRFARASHIFLQLYLYNAARTATNAAPDVELEIKVLRDNKIVTHAPPHKVAVAPGSDPARIFYAAEVPLASMTPGIYLLQVTATDRAGRTTATRELDFRVE
ncbi:MAG TPA: VWA domain-containing protein [Pyrinomonadaceae bacterium]|jgi:VWFA-related protein